MVGLAAVLGGCEVVDGIAREVLLQQASDTSGGAAAPAPAGTGTAAARRASGPAITLSSASGRPGKLVTISATLSTGGATIAGAQNDLRFDPSILSVAVGSKGKPDCFVNPAINKSASAFAFTPSGCSAKSCTGVRALILSLSDVKPIADGSNLYACQVAISADAMIGHHQLGIEKVSLSTPAGDAVSATGTGATIQVR